MANFQNLNLLQLQKLAASLAELCSGNVAIELVGDVGAGKTTFVKGLAAGLGITETIQSPTFTISRQHPVENNPDIDTLSHYDFYRLQDAGIMEQELAEVVNDRLTLAVIEWGDVVAGVLPDDRLTIKFTAPTDDTRNLEIISGGPKSQEIENALTHRH